MIENLGSHRLPPALMSAVSPQIADEIKARNSIIKKKRSKKGSSPQYAENKRWQARKKGLIPPIDYSKTLDEAWGAAGL